MALHRRRLLQLGAGAASALPLGCAPRPSGPADGAADHVITIANSLVELAPDKIVSTTTYNGQFPGPLLRLQEGKRVVVDIRNQTDRPEQLHWHGQKLPSEVDGAAEEGSPFIPPHGTRRIRFTPGPPGLRIYHSHVMAHDNLSAGLYSGQVGPVYIEPRREPGRYDREVFLTLKEFAPSFSRGGDMAMDFLAPSATDPGLKSRGEAAMAASLARGAGHGFEVGYDLFAINGRMLGHGEPIRVRAGERVLFHVLNGSATEIRSLALPGHQFQVVALDGAPTPAAATVPVLWLGTAERISAIVEMNAPGVWVMGDLADDDRKRGMGVVVEYAGRSGPPQWVKPAKSSWDYRLFGAAQTATAPPPDEVFDLLVEKNNAALHGFNQWTLSGVAFDDQAMAPRFHLKAGRRYRLRLRNASDDIHPVHLHRHSFEITRVAGQPTSGVIKDVAMLGGYQELELDFTADNPGRTLFHCHQQLHMDFGFMALFDYV